MYSVSRHTQTDDSLETIDPIKIYYIPLSQSIDYIDGGECMICFEKKNILVWNSQIIHSRIKPHFSLYFDKQLLSKFVDEHPHEAFIINEQKTITFDQIEKDWFEEEGNTLPDSLILPFPCGHEICMNCLRRRLNDYSNHPINHQHSHMQCEYPFDSCSSYLKHEHVQKVLDEDDYIQYYTHAMKYEFPGFKKVICPGKMWGTFGSSDISQFVRKDCKSTILVDINMIKECEVGDLIIRCDNLSCYGNFCYHCRENVSFFQESCIDCKVRNENTNPMAFNYFFNTDTDTDTDTDTAVADVGTDVGELVLYRNHQITFQIATSQLLNLISDINSFYICPICKIPMTKTERCNGISHHDIERCFVCGRIGQSIRGLGNHWSTTGIGGCYRFFSDSYTEAFEYNCVENLCHNHEIGECKDPDHQFALAQLEMDRKRAFVLHAINSLLPDLRFRVLDYLYNYYIQSSENNALFNIFYLPEKSTLELLAKYPERYNDYSEKIVLEQIKKMK
jgi:hypothetical protein